jgi:protoheme IX farnesyltransferase
MSGLIYFVAAVGLNARFMYFVLKLNREEGERPQLPMQTFKFSITYLMLLFAALILDHYLLIAI